MAKPGLSHLAEGAFLAYREAKHGLDNHGDPIPDWKDLSERSRQAWLAAATHVHSVMSLQMLSGRKDVNPSDPINIQISEQARY